MRPPICPLPCPAQCQPVSDFSQQIAEHCSCWFPCLFERCRFRGELVVLAISGSPQLSLISLFRLGQPLPLRPTAPARRLLPAALRCPSASPYFPCLSLHRVSFQDRRAGFGRCSHGEAPPGGYEASPVPLGEPVTEGTCHRSLRKSLKFVIKQGVCFG